MAEERINYERAGLCAVLEVPEMFIELVPVLEAEDRGAITPFVFGSAMEFCRQIADKLHENRRTGRF